MFEPWVEFEGVDVARAASWPGWTYEGKAVGAASLTVDDHPGYSRGELSGDSTNGGRHR